MDRNSLIAGILQEEAKTQELRREERDISQRSRFLSHTPLVSTKGMGLKASLEALLPRDKMPTNVGTLASVRWPFWYRFSFDFGTDPTYTATTKAEDTIQVSQEAAFFLTHIYRDHNDVGNAGFGMPMAFTIRDRQSSRQFNDEPIQVQHLGFKGQPLELETPLLIMPNARITVELTSILTGTETAATTGEGQIQLIAGGIRMRPTDAEALAQSIYK